MSTLRNIATYLWRGSLVRKANVVLGVAGAALSAACAAENIAAPTSASQTQRISADLSTQDAAFDADGDGRLSPAEKDARKAANQISKAQFDSLKKDWEAYKRSVKDGNARAEMLRCEPRAAVEVAKVIGPKGGSFNIGPHKFEVPAGALDSNVTITGRAPTGSVAELDFAPHGLQFNKPVSMTISYKGCVVPDSAALGVSYVENGWRVVQRMPTKDDKASTTVSALTDHFSGYMVTWGRGGQ